MTNEPLGASHAPGATPLDPDEIAALMPTAVFTQAELNEWEQANIVEGTTWARSRRKRQILTAEFLRELHFRMFGRTWTWAGAFRHSNKNIGGDWSLVPSAMQDLLNDTRYWIEHSTYPRDEIGARFHHRLVLIHPFPNGNGRFARLATDVLLERELIVSAFTWGSGRLDEASATRARYIAALRAADKHDITRLVSFVRS